MSSSLQNDRLLDTIALSRIVTSHPFFLFLKKKSTIKTTDFHKNNFSIKILRMLKLFLRYDLIFLILRVVISEQHQKSVIDQNVCFRFLLCYVECLEDQSFQARTLHMKHVPPGPSTSTEITNECSSFPN